MTEALQYLLEDDLHNASNETVQMPAVRQYTPDSKLVCSSTTETYMYDMVNVNLYSTIVNVQCVLLTTYPCCVLHKSKQ